MPPGPLVALWTVLHFDPWQCQLVAESTCLPEVIPLELTAVPTVTALPRANSGLKGLAHIVLQLLPCMSLFLTPDPYEQ